MDTLKSNLTVDQYTGCFEKVHKFLNEVSRVRVTNAEGHTTDKVDLSIECITDALLYALSTPGATLDDALDYGINEWLK
jgi:hypothetical protein